ncbi:MAG: undecaprenyl-diphosphate phosphatase [Candidatus Lokiarchaeota archaeon]|nr:undecaprenyl-diphosphate phosphatase [Candidatus Lokiarchaeota archaeon]
MIQFIIIAILQGLFEWLPISSSGQTMLFSTNFFGITEAEAFSLAIWLHFGTALAVIVRFWKEYVNISKASLPNRFKVEKIDLIKRNWIIMTIIGTAITALPLYFLIKKVFTSIQGDISTLIIAGLLIITGIILLKTKHLLGNKKIDEISDKFFQSDSFIAGLAQGFSILPGISRSAVTVSTILIEGYDQENSLRLSFLMSVPVVIASIVADIVFGEGSIFGTLEPIVIVLSTLVSFIVGYLTMELLFRFARKVQFGYFCIVYGIIAFAIILPILIIN